MKANCLIFQHQTLFDVLPDDLNYNSTGWLVYDESNDNPPAATVETLDPFDDFTLVPHDGMERLPEPDRIVELDVVMDNLHDGKNYAFFNNITYVAPKVPSLYSALSSGEQATDPSVYGTHTHPFVLEKDEIVQLVINNLDSGRHPFHLHGHHFQVVYRSAEEAGTWEDAGVAENDLVKVPMRRDTIVIYPEGNIVLRFKANNPGKVFSLFPLSSSHLSLLFAHSICVNRSLAFPLPHRMARSQRFNRHLCRGSSRATKDHHHPRGPPRRLCQGRDRHRGKRRGQHGQLPRSHWRACSSS